MLGLLSVDGETGWLPLLATPTNEKHAAISPDGGWIAYASDETGQDEIYATRMPQLDRKVTISRGGGEAPVWSPKGGMSCSM